MPIFIFSAALLLALALGLLLYSYFSAFYSNPKRTENARILPPGKQYEAQRESMLTLVGELEAIPYEGVTITGRDGTRLFGRYYEVRAGAPLEIQFHGYRGNALRDFCGGNKLARELGHNTLLVDQRAHGKSGRRTITFGIREREDCLCWVEYAVRRFGEGTPILLSGISMGAATVLMACRLPLPPSVRGVIADSPYSSPAAIIRKVCRDRHLPTRLIYPFLTLGARLIGRFRLADEGAVGSVALSRLPVLLIHGEDDRFVPCEMSREIFAARPEGTVLATFPHAGHGISYLADTDRYRQTVADFADACLSATRDAPTHPPVT